MPTFRKYTTQEVRDAALAYDLDPDFVEAVYAVESSRGTNPSAMTARAVKRKRDSTIVRGPFQLEDDTTFDLIKKHGLGNVNIDDPDVHLDLALRLMSDLKDKYGGDYNKVARAYLGGPGGVADTTLKDELGTTTGAYSNKIMQEMAQLKGSPDAQALAQVPTSFPTADEMDTALVGAPTMEGDLFGMPPVAEVGRSMGPDRVSWSDLVAANRPDNQFALSHSMGGDMQSGLGPNPNEDLTLWLQQLTNEELRDKDFMNA